MTQLWDDFLLRCSLGDAGEIPRPYYWESPDIIPAGTVPVSHATQTYVTDQAYANDRGVNIKADLDNFIYVRSKNLADSANHGNVHLFWSNSQLLNFPFHWENQPIGTPLSLNASQGGEICCNEDAFVWSNVRPLAGNAHYCLISWVQTDKHPSMPGITSVRDLSLFIKQNGNWAQRNVALINPNGSYREVNTNFSEGSESAFITFELQWKNARVGDKIRAFAQKPLLNGETIDTGDITIQSPNGSQPITRYIEANYQSQVDIYYKSDEPTVPSNLELKLNVHLHPESDDSELNHLAWPLDKSELGRLSTMLPDGSVKPLRDHLPKRTSVLCGTQVIRATESAE